MPESKPKLTKAQRAENIEFGGRTYRRFIPYPGPVKDGSLRCIDCGQIDEPFAHDDELCRSIRSGAALKAETMDDVGTYRRPDGTTFEVRDPYYPAGCDKCGWSGSSEDCGTDYWGDDSDVYCPQCHSGSADDGKVARASVRIATPTEGRDDG